MLLSLLYSLVNVQYIVNNLSKPIGQQLWSGFEKGIWNPYNNLGTLINILKTKENKTVEKNICLFLIKYLQQYSS